MKLFRALIAFAFGTGLLVVPILPANAALACPVLPDALFSKNIEGLPTTAGTVGIPFSSTLSANPDIDSFFTIAAANLPSGLSATVVGPLGRQIQISGTPTTAGNFPASLDLVEEPTNTFRCSWTFVINGAGGGGGGGIVEPTLTVGDPVKGGEFVDGKTITCTSSTFSLTPSRIRIYFTKDSVEIPDDIGSNVTSVDVPSAPGAASLKLNDDLVGSTIGCTVYAKSGSTEKTSTTSWGLLTAEPRITRAMEIFEDVLRNGGPTIFDNPAVADQVADGFVGGKFILTGKSLTSFTFSLTKSTGRAPTQIATAVERSVTIVSRNNTTATLQLPEVTSLGKYFLIARTSTKTINLPVNIAKPIVTITNAKALVAKNRFLLEGDKVYGNTYTTTNDVLAVSTTTSTNFKKDFPKGFKLSFNKNTDSLSAETVANLKKLAKLSLTEVTITGYGFKGGTIKANNDLATARANVLSKTLTNAGLKNAEIIIQIEQFDGKYSRQAMVTIR